MDEIEPTDSQKLDYIYQVARQLGKLVESVTPEQIEKVASNPMIGLMMRKFGKGA